MLVFVSMDFGLSQDSHTYNLTMLDEKKLSPSVSYILQGCGFIFSFLGDFAKQRTNANHWVIGYNNEDSV